MMKRRELCAGVATTGILAITGCTGTEGDPTGSTEVPSTDTPTEDPTATPTEEPSTDTPTEEPTEEPTPEEPQFEFVRWNLPSEAEINTPVELGIVVENTGETAGEFTAPLYERTPDSDYTKVGDAEFGTIQAGDDIELVYPDVTYAFIDRYEYRLGDFQQTTAIQTVSASIDWGTQYTTPRGYVFRVDEPDLQDSYEYENFSDEVELKQPDSGGQWAFVDVTVRNETGQTAFSPLATDINLLYGNSQADGETILLEEPINKGEPFDGGELSPGVERSGWILYEIPSDLSVNDITITWSDTTFEGEFGVNWEVQSN